MLTHYEIFLCSIIGKELLKTYSSLWEAAFGTAFYYFLSTFTMARPVGASFTWNLLRFS